MSLADLAKVAPEVQATLTRLHELVKQRDLIQENDLLDVIEKTEQVIFKVNYTKETVLTFIFLD